MRTPAGLRKGIAPSSGPEPGSDAAPSSGKKLRSGTRAATASNSGPGNEPSTGIVVSGLVKTFAGPAGPVHAVRGVDLCIEPGETVALLGPNGAGKSTTLDMMLGLLPPDAGTVSLFGMSPAQAIRAGKIGGMLQTGGLIRFLSVRELLAMMASLYPNPLDVDEVMATTGITEFARQQTHKLSGGQSQRVRAGLALVSNSDLLVLDEPTVALDVEGRHQFWAFMRKIALTGKTVIFATHYLEEADDFADRIVLMARGRIVADGPTTEIKAAVGQRTIKATLPGADLTALSRLSGVVSADARGESVVLTCTDSDAAIRALLFQHPDARDIEITGAGLEQAFLTLTADDQASTTEPDTAGLNEAGPGR